MLLPPLWEVKGKRGGEGEEGKRIKDVEAVSRPGYAGFTEAREGSAGGRAGGPERGAGRSEGPTDWWNKEWRMMFGKKEIRCNFCFFLISLSATWLPFLPLFIHFSSFTYLRTYLFTYLYLFIHLLYCKQNNKAWKVLCLAWISLSLSHTLCWNILENCHNVLFVPHWWVTCLKKKVALPIALLFENVAGRRASQRYITRFIGIHTFYARPL